MTGLNYFPRWTNLLAPILGFGGGLGALYLVGLITFGASPKTLYVGYAPRQPVPYSHKLHVGDMGMDCRYCHNQVEKAAHANIPPASTCMNCHQRIQVKSEKVLAIRGSAATGKPIEWVRVHRLADYVYFDHSAHIAQGVSCLSCHGRVDRMEVVRQEMPLSMAWCLECHRNPSPHLRPKEWVTKLDWSPAGDARELGLDLQRRLRIQPGTDCSICHH